MGFLYYSIFKKAIKKGNLQNGNLAVLNTNRGMIENKT
nr:MAG TPA: Paratox [Caudoviricetes sp.]